MADIVVSLSDNLLKVTYFGGEGFGGASLNMAENIADDSQITDVEKFSEALSGLIAQVVPIKAKKSTINFLVEPQDVILEFVTVSKTNGDVDKQILSIVESKLEKGTVLENLYFSYQKIAPFVYQFIGIKREALGKSLEVSTKLGLELKSVIPWVLLLPKLVNNNQPSIFVSKDNEKQVVALSELNGIYFAGVYEKEKSQKELEKLVQNLSSYKRVTPINKIYTVNCDSFTLDPNYEVLSMEIPGGDLSEAKGYETHLLFNNVLRLNSQFLFTQINLLSLLPVPAVEEKKVPMVKVGAAVVGLVLMFLVGYLLITEQESTSIEEGMLAQSVNEESVVLSEVDEIPESTEVVEGVPPRRDDSVELKRADLRIRVENGSGVAGAAGKARAFLQELDYSVLSVGDAEESDRQKTLLRFKTEELEYKGLLVEDMKTDYELVVEGDLDATLEYDVLVVVGLK